MAKRSTRNNTVQVRESTEQYGWLKIYIPWDHNFQKVFIEMRRYLARKLGDNIPRCQLYVFRYHDSGRRVIWGLSTDTRADFGHIKEALVVACKKTGLYEDYL